MTQTASKSSYADPWTLPEPPSFVGRDRELAALAHALTETGAVILHGAVGSGKTRLAKQLALHADLIEADCTTYVRCEPGDRGVALLCRIERAMEVLPGSVAQVLARKRQVLIVDDAHHLSGAPEILSALIPSAPAAAEAGTTLGPRGGVVFVTRDTLALRRDVPHGTVALSGLDKTAARQLWRHLEDAHGQAPQGGFEHAFAVTRGMPLALRRAYAACASDSAPWSLTSLSRAVRRALEAIAVIAIPVAPAGILALAPELGEGDLFAVLAELVARQLVDPLPLGDGRLAVHDIVRDEVLATMDAGVRTELERAAAALVMSVGSGVQGVPRLAWNAGDDGALGHLDPVDRMRLAARHFMAAGDRAAAIQHLVSHRHVGLRRGGGELLGLIDSLSTKPNLQPDAGGDLALRTLAAAIAMRHGRVAEALDLCAAVLPRLSPGSTELDPVDVASMHYRSGDVAGSRALLQMLCDSEHPDIRCRAAALLAEIELLCGDADKAETLANRAFERDRIAISETARARLHMALAAVEEHAGRIGAARAALARAASSAYPGHLDPAFIALIEARRSICLTREGRLSEAEAVLDQAEQVARELDAIFIADEIWRCRSMVAMRRGDTRTATQILRELVAGRRQRGDEIGALSAELDLAHVLIRRGELVRAAELISACSGIVGRRRLRGLGARLDLLGAMIDLAELRVGNARRELERLAHEPAASAQTRVEALFLAGLAQAIDDPAAAPSAELDTVSTELCDEMDLGLMRARIVLAAGNKARALELTTSVAGRAELAGRSADLAESLAISARLLMGAEQRSAALAAAIRAASEAEACGLIRARVEALLVLAALRRDEGNGDDAIRTAAEAARLAKEAGLLVERMVASVAASAMRGDTPEAADMRHAAQATMSAAALAAANSMLDDLGLSTVRPYRVISAGGADSFVADGSPEALRLCERSLAVDGVRESIVRQGRQVADLRRRSRLKYLFFLFARAPGQIFSKEEIVQEIWQVEYHPLLHDSALFTNIMRIRQLLGDDGSELLRVSEDGYRFVPPKDYIFVEHAA